MTHEPIKINFEKYEDEYGHEHFVITDEELQRLLNLIFSDLTTPQQIIEFFAEWYDGLVVDNVFINLMDRLCGDDPNSCVCDFISKLLTGGKFSAEHITQIIEKEGAIEKVHTYTHRATYERFFVRPGFFSAQQLARMYSSDKFDLPIKIGLINHGTKGYHFTTCMLEFLETGDLPESSILKILCSENRLALIFAYEMIDRLLTLLENGLENGNISAQSIKQILDLEDELLVEVIPEDNDGLVFAFKKYNSFSFQFMIDRDLQEEKKRIIFEGNYGVIFAMYSDQARERVHALRAKIDDRHPKKPPAQDGPLGP